MIILKTVAGNDDVKVAIVQAEGAELMLAAMDAHLKQVKVAEYGNAAIATIVLRNEDNCRRVMAANGADIIVKVMQLHPSDEKVQVESIFHMRASVYPVRKKRKLRVFDWKLMGCHSIFYNYFCLFRKNRRRNL